MSGVELHRQLKARHCNVPVIFITAHDNKGDRRQAMSQEAVEYLLGLKWEDVDFKKSVIYIRRSIVKQKIGPPKTEASQKPIPMNAELAKALRLWKMKTIYNRPDDWVYASPARNGTQPYWPKSIYRVYVKRAADKIGLQKRIGWHTFR